MNIIIFTENNRAGGMDTFYTNLIKSWPNKKDKFIFICNKSHPGLGYLNKIFPDNLKIVGHSIILNWDVSWVENIKIKIIQKILRKLLLYGLLPYQFISIKKLLKNHEAGALISINGGYPAGQTTRLANIAWSSLNKGKSIYSLHGLSLWNGGSKLKIIFEKFMTKKLINSVDHLVCVSSSCANSLDKHPGYKKNKTEVIPNGISLEDEVNNINLRDMLNLDEKVKILLMLAVYDPNKGHSYVFESMKIVLKTHPDCHLIICGDHMGDEKILVENKLKSIIEKRDNIHLLDYIPNASKLIGQADILLIATQGTEAFGLTALEAMKYKKPIVSTEIDALRDTVGPDGIAGYCCDKNNHALYAKKIIYLLDNPDVKIQMGINGNKRLKEKFSAKLMANNYQSLLEK